MGGIYEYKDFYAICNHMPGSDRAFRVGGTVVFRSGGWKARLERDTSGPIGISPLSPKFNLVVTPPEGVATTNIDPVDVEYREEDPAFEYYEALISVRGDDGMPTDDPPPPRLRVEHPNGKSVPEPEAG